MSKGMFTVLKVKLAASSRFYAFFSRASWECRKGREGPGHRRIPSGPWGLSLGFTSSLHCSSFMGLPFRMLHIELVKPKKRNYNGDYRQDLVCTTPEEGLVA